MSGAVPVLELNQVTMAFGGLTVLRDLSLSVSRGVATALIGPNGAGKSTVFNVVSGVYRPTSGDVLLDGADLANVPSHQRIRRGIARSFQNVRLMPHLSVCENLIVGQHVRASGLRDLLTPFRLVPNHRWRREAIDALAEVGLQAYVDEPVGALPYGVRKQVDLVRATLAGASLLMLDEPAAGLNPTETNALRQHLDRLKARGITLFVVEHDMHFVGQVCERVIVLNFGEKIAEGTLQEVQKDAQVRAAYLGSEETA
jgi:ABC-type branched-subunit amino acid transport system ATPase component